MSRKSISDKTVYILLLLTVISWGGAWPLGSIVVHALPALFAALLRYTIALPIFIIAALSLEKNRLKEDFNFRSIKNHLYLMLLGLLQITLYNLFFFSGLKYTSSSDATLIIASNPIFTAIFASLLYKDERLTGKRMLGLLFAISGVILIVIQSPNTDVENRLLGDFIILMAAMTWASFTVLAKPLLKKIKPLTFSAIVTSYGWLFLFISALVIDTEYFKWDVIVNLENEVVSSLIFLAVFAAAMAYIFFNKGIEIIGPSRTSVFVNLVPVFGVTFSIILLGDNFSSFYILAFAMIVSGVYLVNKYR